MACAAPLRRSATPVVARRDVCDRPPIRRERGERAVVEGIGEPVGDPRTAAVRSRDADVEPAAAGLPEGAGDSLVDDRAPVWRPADHEVIHVRLQPDRRIDLDGPTRARRNDQHAIDPGSRARDRERAAVGRPGEGERAAVVAAARQGEHPPAAAVGPLDVEAVVSATVAGIAADPGEHRTVRGPAGPE